MASTFFGSGDIPLLENTNPKNVTEALLNSHFDWFKGNHGLLSYKTVADLGIIDLQVDLQVNKVEQKRHNHELLIQQCPGLFKGMKNVNIKLHIDKQVNPVAQDARHIPFHF